MITDAKHAIRSQVGKKLRAWAPAHRGAASAAVCARLKPWLTDEGVLLYAALPDEVDVTPLFATLLDAGRALLLPRVQGDVMVPVPITDPAAQLVSGAFGILEPHPDLAAAWPMEVGTVVLPGRAFDLHGHRLGRGKGYYDRFLAQLSPDVARIGVCFEMQVVDDLPVASHDIPAHVVVTESRLIHGAFHGEAPA